jgi:hypothetical protein
MVSEPPFCCDCLRCHWPSTRHRRFRHLLHRLAKRLHRKP